MAVISDPAFQDEKCRQTGALSHAVSVTTPGDRLVIDTVRMMPMDSLPDFARSFLGGKLEVHEVQDWGPAGGGRLPGRCADGRDHGYADAAQGHPRDAAGRPGSGGSGGATTVTIRSVLKANIPFIGGKAEEAAAGPIRAAVSKEEELGQEWLSRSS